MSSKPYNFKQRDLTRAMRATQAAGIKAHYEIDTKTKTIRIIPDESPAPNNGAAGANPWDEEAPACPASS
jgi:hypothetical protein